MTLKHQDERGKQGVATKGEKTRPNLRGELLSLLLAKCHLLGNVVPTVLRNVVGTDGKNAALNTVRIFDNLNKAHIQSIVSKCVPIFSREQATL